MNLQTPTTTDKDRQTANILAALAGLDLDVFTEELFSVTEDEGGSLEELMNRDIVFEDIMGIRLMITKVNVPQVEPYRDRAEDMQHGRWELSHPQRLLLTLWIKHTMRQRLSPSPKGSR